MTLELLMMVVLAVAVALAAARLWPRVQERHARALLHRSAAVQWRQAADWCIQGRALVRKDAISPERRVALGEMSYEAGRPYFYRWEVNDLSGAAKPVPAEESIRAEVSAACRERADYH